MRDIKPTRMELLSLQRKLALAKNGHRLLKKKRDGLIIELRQMLREVKDIKGKLIEKIKKANDLILDIEMNESPEELELVSSIMFKTSYADVLIRNVMGVSLPKIRPQISGRAFEDSKYDLTFFSLDVIRAVKLYEEIFIEILKTAEIETSIRNLLDEIEKTKRRVNALENNVIPRIEGDIAWIKMMLDEMERENVVRLKRILSKS